MHQPVRSSFKLAWGAILLLAFLSLLSSCSNNIPSSYPEYRVTAHKPDPGGYYFLCAIKKYIDSPSVAPVNLILDSKGQVVYYKVFNTEANIGDFELQPNGFISYSDRDTFMLMDSDFRIIDSVFCKNGIFNDRHDFHILPNGHFLLLGYELVAMNLDAYHLKDKKGCPWQNEVKVKCGVFQELDANKNVIFEWHARDHYNFSDADETWFEGPGILDWTHFNSIVFDTDGNYLLSVRNFNEVTKISSKDGSIIWRLGGKSNQFTFLNDTLQFIGQHDVKRIANGNVTLYDNGNKDHPASAKEYDLDETNHTIKLIWSYTPKSHSSVTGLGNVQRLESGETLINYGRSLNDSIVFNVIDLTGTKIFELAFKNKSVSYRVFRYVQLPLSFKRPTVSCDYHNGYCILEASAGYKNYFWSNGATTQQIAVSSPGSYQVFVAMPNGGYTGSGVIDLK